MLRSRATIILASLAVIYNCVEAVPACTMSEAPTVKLDSATVSGIASGSVNQFLGIPYAQPPTGRLRFRLPEARPAYDTDFSAVDSGPWCAQKNFGSNSLGPLKIELATQYINTDNVTYSEDCLTLNVVTPASATPSSKLPVLVWIHGGAFEAGSKSDPNYDGQTVVESSLELGIPVVYVAINYRLNIFGFLAGNEVKAAGVGNLGLQDQRLALRWIQKYIRAFGGDPTKVTIWGESAGSMSVSFQMLANGGNPEGLFRAAFMESGSPINSGDMSTAQLSYDVLVRQAGCSGSADTLDCLRDVPYESLMEALDTVPELTSGGTLKSPYCPRIDGVFLTENPYDLVRRRSVANVPFINGVCDDEGTVFSMGTSSKVLTDPQFAEYLQTTWMVNSPANKVRQVMMMYPSDPAQGSPFNTGNLNAITPQYKRLSAFHGDLVFQGPRRHFLENLSLRQNTWTFVSKRNKTLPVVGSAHTTDISNVFGGGDMTSYLIRFAANLDPNIGHSTDIYWPKYNVLSRPMLEFGEGFSMLWDVGYDRVAAALDSGLAQVSMAPELKPQQSVITDTFRLPEIGYLFTQVAESNPF